MNHAESFCLGRETPTAASGHQFEMPKGTLQTGAHSKEAFCRPASQAVVEFCHLFYPFHPQKTHLFGFCFSHYIPATALGARQKPGFAATLVAWLKALNAITSATTLAAGGF